MTELIAAIIIAINILVLAVIARRAGRRRKAEASALDNTLRLLGRVRSL